MKHAIDHCELSAEVRDRMTVADFKEAVVARAAQIVEDAKTNSTSRAHKLAAVELVARSLASTLIDQGSAKIAKDLGIDFRALKEHLASIHISFC